MLSVRQFATSVNMGHTPISVHALAQHCGVQTPISVRALITSGCIQEFGITLNRQTVFEGAVPYTGSLQSGSGTMIEVSVPFSGALEGVLFVKMNHGTDDCGDEDAVVWVPAGSSIGPSEFEEIYGTRTPQIPIHFIACVSSDISLDFVVINVRVSLS
jgi:hypothetical protein